MPLLKTWAFVLAIVVLASVPARAAHPAADRAQSFYGSLLDTMKQGPQLGMQGRYHALEPAVDASFAIPAMIEFIVGAGRDGMKEGDKTRRIAAVPRVRVPKC